MMNRTAWIKRRARRLMAAFGAPRSKAVRYAADDYKAFKGAGRRTCEELGVCQGRKDCDGCALPPYPFAPGVITSYPARSASMEGFRRFLGAVTGGRHGNR